MPVDARAAARDVIPKWAGWRHGGHVSETSARGGGMLSRLDAGCVRFLHHGFRLWRRGQGVRHRCHRADVCRDAYPGHPGRWALIFSDGLRIAMVAVLR